MTLILFNDAYLCSNAQNNDFDGLFSQTAIFICIIFDGKLRLHHVCTTHDSNC